MRHWGACLLFCSTLVLGLAGIGTAGREQAASAAQPCNVGCGSLYATNYVALYRVIPVPQSQATTAPMQLTPSSGGGPSSPAVSPDGTRIIYNVANHLALVTTRNPQVSVFRPYQSGFAIGAASWSPDGRQVAFALEDERTDILAPYGIAIADAATGAVKASWALAKHDRRDPWWAPDGRHIVASEQESIAQGPYRALISLDATTGAAQSITHDPAHDYNRPAVSPNGRQIAVLRSDRNSSANEQLVVMNADGSGATVLAEVGGAGRPAWSPDGTYVAFTTGAATYLIAARGGTPLRVTSITGNDVAWSAAGASATHTATRSFGPGPGPRAGCGVGCGTFVVNGGAYLFRVPARGGTGRQITTTGSAKEPDQAPAISPDGRTLAYSAAGGAGIRLVPIDGGKARLLGSLPFPDAPAWSPNGTAIAVGFNNAVGGYHGIAVLDAMTGAELLTYTSTGGEPLQPAWTPDGRSLIASQTSGASFGLVRIDLASQGGRLITHDAAHNFFHPQVSPDGRLIAAIRTTSVRATTGDLWVMRIDGSGGHAIASGILVDQIAWAPDGTSIAADRSLSIVAVPLSGGTPRVVVRNATQPAWSSH
jgi:Tol biopolymer transport system component